MSDPDRDYKTVLPYGALAKRVREVHIPAAPECMHGVLEDLAEAFQLAARKVHDRDSERSHLANIMHCSCDVDFRMPPGLDLETEWLVDEFGPALTDAYEVLEWGDSLDDKPALRQFNPPPELR